MEMGGADAALRLSAGEVTPRWAVTVSRTVREAGPYKGIENWRARRKTKAIGFLITVAYGKFITVN